MTAPPPAFFQVLRGLTRDKIHSSLSGPLRSSWEVHPGMARCMSRALASPFHTHVVSINWSQDVIATILSETLFEGSRWVALVHDKRNGIKVDIEYCLPRCWYDSNMSQQQSLGNIEAPLVPMTSEATYIANPTACVFSDFTCYRQ